jgi:hypothetical protein
MNTFVTSQVVIFSPQLRSSIGGGAEGGGGRTARLAVTNADKWAGKGVTPIRPLDTFPHKV